MALLYYITERRLLQGEQNAESALRGKVRQAFLAGVDYVQIREKEFEGGPLAELVEDLVSLRESTSPSEPLAGANGFRPRILVNDRLDVACSCGADGVHLPANSLPVAMVRKFVGEDWIVGAACHSIEEVERAAAEGADHVLVAPVFDTASKPGLKPMGLERFAEICRRSPVPVFALGGISLGNARSCIEAGAAGLAGIRLFQQASDMHSLCRQLREL